MLAQKYRLNRRQVNILYKKGKSKHFGDIGIKYLPNGLDHNRYSVIVPKSLVKKVVERNRLRRIIFEELKKTSGENGDYLVRLFKVAEENVLRDKVKSIFTE